MEPLSRKIDLLQEQLEETMKQRLSMITRQVREIKAHEDEIRQIKRKLENFDRYASTGNLAANQSRAQTMVVFERVAISILFFYMCRFPSAAPSRIFALSSGRGEADQHQVRCQTSHFSTRYVFA